MKKVFYIIGLVVTFITGCFLNKKYGWGLGDKIANCVQKSADFIADKLEKTRGNKEEITEITSEGASETSASS